jgi:drug/metabolite transporter (DMT)-like permease
MILASVCFSLLAALVKFVSPRIPVFEIVLWRCVLALPIMAWLLKHRKVPLVATRLRLVAVRTLFGFVAMSLFFFSLSQLYLADAVLLAKMQPLWIAMLAPWLLKERPSVSTLASVVVSMLGVALILQPSLSLSATGAAAVVASALASAIAHLTIRRLSADDDPGVIVFNFMAGTALLALPLAAPTAVIPCWIDALALTGIAVLATMGQVLLTRAYAVEEAPVVAAAGYASVVFGVLWGLLFWSEVPTALTWIGGVLLVVSGLALVWFRRHVAGHAYVPHGH